MTRLVFFAIIMLMDKKDNEIKKLKMEIARLKKMVVRDELTGVLNRRGLMKEFECLFHEAQYARHHPGSKRKIDIDNLSIVFLDVDNFKHINDTYGHLIGDRVLKLTAKKLQESIRGLDLLGRIGGEEFVIVFVGASEEDAFKKAEDIRNSIKKICFMPDNCEDLKITFSIGVSSLKKSTAADIMDLIFMADKAMYEAKTNRGKDNTVKYSDIA